MSKNSNSPLLVSIIIPTYNRAELLAQAIQSVVSQTYDNWELLIIDDGSTESIADVVSSFSESRIFYHRQMNQGVSVARNLGIQLARGKYVAFLDSDDMFEPNYLEEKTELAKNRPDVGVVGGGCRYVDLEGNALQFVTLPRESVTYEDLAIWSAFPGCTGNIFAERELLISVGGFRANLFASEDRDLLRRMAEIKPVLSVQGITAIIRVHEMSRENRDLSSLIYSRRWVTKQIKEPHLRKRSSAWNEHVFGLKQWKSGARLRAVFHWCQSFLIHPGCVHQELSRVREIADLLMPTRLR